jgi:hypothetical protein
MPFFATFAVSFASFAVKDLDRKVRNKEAAKVAKTTLRLFRAGLLY